MTPSTRNRPSISRAIAAPFHGLFELVFRSSCLLCGKSPSSSPVCPECASLFQRLGEACCAKCGRPTFEPSAVEDVRCFVCETCLKERPHFDQAFSIFLYEGAIRNAILAFKYQRRFSIKDSLGPLFASNLPDRLRNGGPGNALGAELIIPVPLHVSRLREREFNQSAILANYLSKAINVPVQYEVLARIRATEFQSTLARAKRIANVKGAFKVTQRRVVEGANVLLVDDIFTCGATANECAKVLKKAGAKSVVVGTLATPPLGHSGDDSDTEGEDVPL
ncbi:MAG TPA: ComF family protein [bacterium]|nr:ComF family protein [bacterium]